MSGAVVSIYDGLEPEAPANNPGGATKKLARGISRATENAAIVSHARSQLAFLGAVDTPEFTFSLPDLSVYPGRIKKKLFYLSIDLMVKKNHFRLFPTISGERFNRGWMFDIT